MSTDREDFSKYLHPSQNLPGSSSNKEAFIYMRLPPDGGWAWVVLTFSFLAGATIDGILLCIGHLLPEIAAELSLKTSTSAMISSIQYGLYFLVGPFVSAAMNKYGFRIISCIGAVLSAGGMVAGSLSKDFLLLLLLFGALGTVYLFTNFSVSALYFISVESLSSVKSFDLCGCDILMPPKDRNDSSSSEEIEVDDLTDPNKDNNRRKKHVEIGASSVGSSKSKGGVSIKDSKTNNTAPDASYSYMYDLFHVPPFQSKTFIYARIPPDKGWAWLVLFCSFISLAGVDGILLCIGSTLVDIKEELNLKIAETAIISSVQNGVYYIIGPFVSVAVNKFGFRKVALTGCAIAACGMFAGSTVQNYGMLLLMCGIFEIQVTDDLTNAEKDNNHSSKNEETDVKSVNSVDSDDSVTSASKSHVYNIFKSENFIYATIPPDKGWAWVVLFSSFINLAIINGIRLSGAILSGIKKDLQLKTTGFATIISAEIGVYYFSGPFVSTAQTRYGFRKVGFYAGLLSACGMLGASVARNYTTILLMIGVFVGVGFGMIYATSQVVVGYYFEKYRAIATGISCAGTGFGTLVFSKLNQYLVKEVGWRHTLQVHGGFCILISIMSLAFRPVPPKKIGSLEPTQANDSDLSVELASARYSNFFSADSLKKTKGENLEYNIPAKEREESSFWRKICPCCFKKTSPPIAEENPDTDIRIVDAGPIYRDDIFYAGNVMDLPEYQRFDSKETVPPEQERKSISYNLSVTRVPRETGVKKKRCQMPRSIKDAFNLLLDMSIVKLFRFQVILMSSFLFIFGNNIPYLFITMRSEIPEAYANWLLPSLGILNIIFRIGSGFLSFKLKKVDPAYLVGGGLIISGLVGILSSGYGQDLIWFQYFHVFVFSVGASLFSSLRTIIFVNILGLSKLTNAFGITSLVMGIGTFTGTTLGGVLVDLTGNYDAAFQFSGWSFLMSGICNCYIPYVASKVTQKTVRFQ